MIVSRGHDEFAAFLSARYDFEGNANDTSGNGQHLTASGTVISTNTYTNSLGRPEGVATFDGTDDYCIKTNLSAALWSNSLGVVSLWTLADDQDAAEEWLAVGTSDNTDLVEVLQSTTGAGALRCRLNLDTTTQWGTVRETPIAGVWIHTVVVQAGTVVTWYTNGLATYTETIDAERDKWIHSIFESATQDIRLVVGALPSTTSQRFDGIIDNIKIYSGTTCSVAHVSWLYANTHPTNCMEYRAP